MIIDSQDAYVTIDQDGAESASLVFKQGRLDIVNGGTLTSDAPEHLIGSDMNTATMRIAGDGSLWEAFVSDSALGVRIGRDSSGTIIVADGGEFRVQGDGNRLILGERGGPGSTPGRGTLVIGGEEGSTALAPGFVSVDEIHMGRGDGGDGTEASGLIVFNHTDTNYTFAPNVLGVGGILQQNGTTVLTGANSYKGKTVVTGGALRAGTVGALSSESDYVIDGGRLELNGKSLTMSSLSGTGGEVVLGTVGGGFDNVTLTIDQDADTTFAGGIVGPDYIYSIGQSIVIKDGLGSLTLTGRTSLSQFSDYSGGVLVHGGTLTLADGGEVSASWLTVGKDGQDGTLRIVGDGSQYYASGVVEVGAVGGDALISVEDGGLVKNGTTVFIGHNANATGRVVLAGASKWEQTRGNFIVGNNGRGVLKITDDSEVQSANAKLGSVAGAGGTATVDGSWWFVKSNHMFVGEYGTGELSVLNGGRVIVGSNGPRRSVLIGHGFGASGSTVVAGTGSSLEAADVLVGNSGSGELLIVDGGEVKASNVFIAQNAASVGTLRIGSGGAAGALTTSTVTFGAGDGELVFDHTDSNYTFATRLVAEDGGVLRHQGGTTRLTGDNSLFKGETVVSGGTLIVERSLNGTVDVAGGGTLAGNGLVGSTTVAGGGALAPGAGTGTMPFRTLTVNGDLTLQDGASVRLALGEPGTADDPAWGWNGRIDVWGDLTLAGTFDFEDGKDAADDRPSFGYYRLMTYDGTLTDNGISVGTEPDVDGSATKLLIGDGRIDLFVAALGDDALQHWQGGDGVWDGTAANWLNLDGELPVTWAGNHAVFKNEPGGFDGGAVAVAGVQQFAGLQFVDDGYILSGDGQLETVAEDTEIRVLADRADIVTAITGTGGVLKTEEGTLVLSGDNTYTGGTTIARGMLQVSRDENLGDASGQLVFAGGALRVTGDASGGAPGGVPTEATMQRAVLLASQGLIEVSGGDGSGDVVLDLAGPVSGGAGMLVKTGAGELILSGSDNTYSGGTAVRGGLLTVTGEGALGSGDVLVTGRDTEMAFRGVEAGARIISVADGARLSLRSGANAAEAVIVTDADAVVDVSDGTGAVALGSLAGDGRVLVGGRQLVAGGLRRDDTFAGVIDDGGAGGGLVKTGSGTFTLTGDHQYSGTTVVAEGTLHVDGSIAASSHVAVQSGATLRGTGVVGRTTVEGGGTLAAAPRGPLTVDGDLTFAENSRFTVSVDPEKDDGPFVLVAGDVHVLGGSVVHIGAVGPYAASSTYRLLQADGALTGRFADVKSNFAFLTPDLLYDDARGNVDLRLVRNDIRFQAKASTRNRRAVAEAVEGLGGDHAVYGAVAALHDDPNLIAEAFDSLSGEVHAAVAGRLPVQSGLFGDAVTGRLNMGVRSGLTSGLSLGVSSAIPFPTLQGARREGETFDWIQLIAARDNDPGDDNVAGLVGRTTGVVLGADRSLAGNWITGIAVGYIASESEMDTRHSTVRSDNIHIGLYSRFAWNTWRLSGGLMHARHGIATERTVRVGGWSESLTARYDAHTTRFIAEMAYDVSLSPTVLQPFVRLVHGGVTTEGFTEQGGNAALSADPQTRTRTSAAVGVRMDYPFAIGTTEVRWRAELSWSGDVGGGANAGAVGTAAGTAGSTHRFDSGQGFTVMGVAGDTTGLRVETGMGVRISNDVTLEIIYEGQFGSSSPAQSLKTALNVKF